MALNFVHLKTNEQSHRVSQNMFWSENGVLLLLSHLVSGLEYFMGSEVKMNSDRFTNTPRHEISNNVVCATSKGSDQPAHTRSLIRAFASRLNIL